MSASTYRIARRFVRLGGRLIMDPQGRTTFGLDAETVFSFALTARRQARSIRVARAAQMLCWHEPENLAALIAAHGKCGADGWVVWEGR